MKNKKKIIGFIVIVFILAVNFVSNFNKRKFQKLLLLVS
ncbi:hypothetical protein NPD5_2953 [Clostridium sporogenes]|uniref:Uncharacterized protein n=1 Tax=Clostridium sporogenes TaxID=1509 RepID=A0A1L3NMK0_CLOSG|nr:hypothetical protein NPD5_2953 [Clostridium sporogenes]